MEDRTFQLLLYKIQKERGFDFTQYRPAILKRRIGGRLRARRVNNYLEYINLINKEPEEYEKLIDVATINVTEFFRDPSVWEVVKKILSGLIQNKDQKGQRLIRVWSAGTSGGEEAYTFAILFHELLGDRLNEFRIKIYGTDIDRTSLERAKIGEYPPENIRNVSPSLLKKYFQPTKNGFVVDDSLRLMTQFMRHNLVTQKPLGNIDLLICRNVLIYFSKALQEEVLKKFYRALNPNGFLMLGECESLPSSMKELFKTLSSREKIYQKR